MSFATTCNSTATESIVFKKCVNDHKANGMGNYVQKAYNPNISVICEFQHLVLRIVEAYDTKYQILWEGEVLSTYSNRNTAESYFMDFAGIGKAKFNKMKKA